MRLSRWASFVFPLLLGLMVLAWGTGYKVSLYHPAQAHDATPAAKLCTRASDQARCAVEHAASPRGFEREHVLLLALALFAGTQARVPVARATDARVESHAPPLTQALFRRPPPMMNPSVL